jgi:hypothetical protein
MTVPSPARGSLARSSLAGTAHVTIGSADVTRSRFARPPEAAATSTVSRQLS